MLWPKNSFGEVTWPCAPAVTARNAIGAMARRQERRIRIVFFEPRELVGEEPWRGFGKAVAWCQDTFRPRLSLASGTTPGKGRALAPAARRTARFAVRSRCPTSHRSDGRTVRPCDSNVRRSPHPGVIRAQSS